MSLFIRNLSVLNYANGFTLWLYKSREDTLEEIRKVNYFADAADMLAPGDMIMISTKGGGAIVTVDENDGPDISVSLLL